MSNFYRLLIPSVLSVATQIYATSKILNVNPNLKRLKEIFAIIFAILSVTILFVFIQDFSRAVIIICILMVVNCLIFEKDKTKIILTTFLVNTLFALSEIIFSFAAMFVLKIDANEYGSLFFGSLISNLIISIIVVFIVNIPLVFTKIYNFVNTKIEFERKYIILLIFIGSFVSAVSIYSAYFKLNNMQLLLIMAMFIIIYTAFMVKLFHERAERSYTQSKNDVLIENISEYEKIIEIQKIDAHENKNQLRIIRGMILQENQELITYVDELINEKLKKDANLLSRVQDIPNGGLRALIYSKLVCLDNNYNVNLIVSRNINTKTLDAIDSKTNVDMCKILGVFLDNAIEATSLTTKKIIGISLYTENKNFKIIVSNSFENELNFDKIDMVNYSTKGKNRGHGLPLVKMIIKSNKKLKNTKKIDNDIFSQILSIRL